METAGLREVLLTDVERVPVSANCLTEGTKFSVGC